MPPKKLLVILVVLLVAACRRQPELIPTAAVPTSLVEAVDTVVATSTAPPPTATLPPTATPVPPTATALPTATAVPPTPTLLPTPTPEVALAVTSPEPEATLEVGNQVTVVGEATPGESLTISLAAAGVTLLESNIPREGDSTTWEMALTIPESITGPAALRVSQPGEDPVEVPVLLRRSATSGTAISLSHPDADTIAVASQALFFLGRVQQPVNGEVTIAVLYEECESIGARQTFDVGEGGQWWGYIVIPGFVSGPACAVAYTGGFEEAGWRAATTPLTILEENDPAGQGIFIGNFPFQELVPGEQVAVYGSAYNTDEVEVSLVVDSEVVAEGTAAVDRFGYWEINLPLPADVADSSDGFFVAATTYGDERVVARGSFLVAGDE